MFVRNNLPEVIAISAPQLVPIRPFPDPPDELIGRADLSLGRLYEGHVNTIRLIQRYGAPAQTRRAAADARVGRLFGVWNTEQPGVPLRLRPGGTLLGGKILCSGAGYVARALVTAREAGAENPRMVLVALAPGERADLSGWRAQGMRASASGTVDFTGMVVGPDALIGQPGDYTRQPDFSAGAWRFAAVQCGGAEALLGALRAHLRATERGGDPHQAARLGQAAMAASAARLWVEAAAARAEAAAPGEAAVAFVNLARLAVERAALDLWSWRSARWGSPRFYARTRWSGSRATSRPISVSRRRIGL